MKPAPRRRSRVAHLVRSVAIDLTPLRDSRDFRLLWAGEIVSETGYQMALVGVYVQVYSLTGSPAAVGLVGLVGLVALACGSVLAQSIVDAVDRRKMLAVTQLGLSAGATTLLAGALAGRPPVAVVYAGVAITSFVSAIDNPTRSAMTPVLVGTQRLPAALALNQAMWNSTSILGPAIGGVVIARLGLTWTYAIDLVTYAATLGTALLIRPMPPGRPSGRGAATGLAAVREGLTYLRGRRILQSTFSIDLVAMAFGMPRALFPILAVTQFHRGAEVVGLLFAAPGVGALAGALASGWVSSVRHQGRTVIWAVAGWGAGIAAFGLVGDHLAPALACLAFAGAADVISAVFRSTILQSSVPDALRGRVSAIHILVVTGGPRLGDLEAGLVAQALSPTVSVVSGGLLCIVGAALVALLVPEFRRYHAGERA